MIRSCKPCEMAMYFSDGEVFPEMGGGLLLK